MLNVIKHNNKDKIEEFIDKTSIFLREFYTQIVPDNNISLLEMYNNPKTISDEIKNKQYQYFLISYENTNIGNAVVQQDGNLLNIAQIFILKKYRKKKLSYKIIKELRCLASNQSLEGLKIAIFISNIKLKKIVEKWGFKKADSIARYIGDGMYLYEDIYTLT